MSKNQGRMGNRHSNGTALLTRFLLLNALVAWLMGITYSVPVVSSPHCITKGENKQFFLFSISEEQNVKRVPPNKKGFPIWNFLTLV